MIYNQDLFYYNATEMIANLPMILLLYPNKVFCYISVEKKDVLVYNK